MKIIAFDLDGVVCTVPTRIKFLMKIFYLLMVIPQIRYLYNKFLRKIDRKIYDFMKHLTELDVKIVIITGNSQSYQKDLEHWLKKRKVNYDQIYCFPLGHGIRQIAEWKAKKAKELNVDFFIEDLSKIADYLRCQQIKVVLYNGKNIDDLWTTIK